MDFTPFFVIAISSVVIVGGIFLFCYKKRAIKHKQTRSRIKNTTAASTPSTVITITTTNSNTVTTPRPPSLLRPVAHISNRSSKDRQAHQALLRISSDISDDDDDDHDVQKNVSLLQFRAALPLDRCRSPSPIQPTPALHPGLTPPQLAFIHASSGKSGTCHSSNNKNATVLQRNQAMDLMSAPAVMVPRGISAQPSEDRESERAPSRLEGYLPSPLPRPLNHARPVITDKKPLMPSAKATVSITRAAVRKLDLSDTLKTKTPLSEPTMITVGPLSSAASPSHIAHKNLTPQLQDMTTNSTQAATQQTQTQLTAATSRQQQQQQQSGATAPSTPVRQRVEDKTSSSDLYKGKEELTRHPPQAILPKDHQQPVFTDVLTETVKYALLGANPTADSNGASLGLKKPAAASTTATVKAETTVVNVDSSTDSSGPNTAHLVLGPYLPPTPDFSSNIPSSDSDPNGNAGVVHPPARALMHAASSSSSPSSSPPLTAHKKVNNNNAHTPVKQVPSPEPTAIARAPSPVPKTVHTLDPLLRSEPTVADLSPLPIRPPRRKPSLLAHQSERQQQQQQQQQPQHRHQNYVQRKLFSPSELPSSETCKTPSPTLTPTPIPTATPIPFPLTSKSTSTPAMQQPSAPTAQFTTSAIAAFPLPPVLSSSRPSSPNGKEIVAEHYHKQGQEQHMRYQDQARNISPVPSITTTSSDQNSSMSVIPNNASSANTSFVSLRDDADIQAEAGAISPVMDHVSPVPTSVTSPTTPYSAKTLETTSSPSASIPEASPLPPLQYQSQHKPSSKELVLTAAWLQDPPAAGPGGRKKRAGDPQLGDFGTRLSQFNFDE